MAGFFQKLFGPKVDFQKLVEDGAMIVDVRTPAEYAGGHIKGSVNIPLDQVEKRMSKIKGYGKPVIACCRSGMRSRVAAGIMKNNGVEAYNGGPWDALKYKAGI